MKPLRIVWRVLQILLHLLLAVVTALFGTKVVVGHKKQVHPRLISWWKMRLCRIFQLQISITGQVPTHTSLIVANHISWLDIIVLGATAHTSFLSKAEVGDWPLVGWLSRATGTLFIRRGQGQSSAISDAIAGLLSEGQTLTLFPEGRTSDGSTVKTFFPRLFGAAISANVAVVPVTIAYESEGKRDLLAPYIDDQHILDNALKLLGRKSSIVHIHFGTAIASDTMDRKQLATMAHDNILANLALPYEK